VSRTSRQDAERPCRSYFLEFHATVSPRLLALYAKSATRTMYLARDCAQVIETLIIVREDSQIIVHDR
jgi:hypothetical protein